MDAGKLRQIFEKLDEALEYPTELLIRGGAAVLAYGLEQRVTIDIDVLPSSRFVEADLRHACVAADLGFNPWNKDFAEKDYLEVVPEETLILPRPDPDRGYNTIFRGRRLTVRTPPASDLVIGKLKRLDPEDLADVTFLIRNFQLTDAGQSPLRRRGPSMNEDRASRWQAVLRQMFEELRSGSPRAEVYWAQQLAFGPVFFYAVLLAVRNDAIPANDLELLRRVVPYALSTLGALPDGSEGDPARLLLLARRQAQALSCGRRQHLAKLSARLGLKMASLPYDPVPRRFQRPYELIGWNPPPTGAAA
jgi:hypothetical protein